MKKNTELSTQTFIQENRNTPTVKQEQVKKSKDENIEKIYTKINNKLYTENTKEYIKKYASDVLYSVVYQAPINIALIKYWGKKDENLILPWNSSLSITQSPKVLSTIVRVTVLKDTIINKHNNVQLRINDIDVSIENHPILLKAIKICQNYTKTSVPPSISLSYNNFLKKSLIIETWSTIPIATGLASSSAIYSAQILCLSKIYGVCWDIDRKVYNLTILSTIVRQISGSACRSLFPGFVRWNVGDNLTSYSEEIFVNPTVYKNLRIIILTSDIKKKMISSRDGMRCTVETSYLFQQTRNENYIQDKLKNLFNILNTTNWQDNWEDAVEIIIKESNQFHALCMDTYPPLQYLDAFSKYIIYIIHIFNKYMDIKIAYTFDAGSHPILIFPITILDTILQYLNTCIPILQKLNEYNFIDELQETYISKKSKPPALPSLLLSNILLQHDIVIKNLWITTISSSGVQEL